MANLQNKPKTIFYTTWLKKTKIVKFGLKIIMASGAGGC